MSVCGNSPWKTFQGAGALSSRRVGIGSAVMDELAAAAAVLNMGDSTDAQASGGVGAPGDGSARDNPASPEIEGVEAEKENNNVDAATQEVEDANPQVSKPPLPPLHSPFAPPLALHDSHACRPPVQSHLLQVSRTSQCAHAPA